VSERKRERERDRRDRRQTLPVVSHMMQACKQSNPLVHVGVADGVGELVARAGGAQVDVQRRVDAKLLAEPRLLCVGVCVCVSSDGVNSERRVCFGRGDACDGAAAAPLTRAYARRAL
jgi:hypothetical protein